jgi:3-deoxy-manno-octulosonate cytidylyltransferase (CMP-KDO synthetase)
MRADSEKKEVVGVIPARYSSTRYEAKVLADICGKPMIQRVWERARQSLLLDELIIACDDERIAKVASEFGAKVTMTAKGHVCGSDRIAEVVNPLEEARIIINIQGDEPLVHPSMIDAVASALLYSNGTFQMATIIKRITDQSQLSDPHVVKVVVGKNDFAMYFSRSPIPFHAANSEIKEPVYFKHIGLYGYTKDFLFTFKNLAVSQLEKVERLEQLRVLEEGYKIKVIETKYDTLGVDTAEDLEKARQFFSQEKG